MSFGEQDLPYINPQFIGMGHALQEKKRERRKAREEQQLLESKVQFYKKEERKTSKSIDKQRQLLEKIVSVKHRQHQQMKEKQLHKYLKQQQINRLKLQSEFQRKTHLQNKQQAVDKLARRNKHIYYSIKDRTDRDVSHRRQQSRNEKQYKREHYEHMLKQKERAKRRIEEFKRQRNQDAVQEYTKLLELEGNRSQSSKNNINQLQAKEHELIQRLQKSYLQKQLLKNTLEKAYKTSDISALDELVKPRSQGKSFRIGTGFATTRNSNMTGKQTGAQRSGSPELLKAMHMTLNSFRQRPLPVVIKQKPHKSANKKSGVQVFDSDQD